MCVCAGEGRYENNLACNARMRGGTMPRSDGMGATWAGKLARAIRHGAPFRRADEREPGAVISPQPDELGGI